MMKEKLNDSQRLICWLLSPSVFSGSGFFNESSGSVWVWERWLDNRSNLKTSLGGFGNIWWAVFSILCITNDSSIHRSPFEDGMQIEITFIVSFFRSCLVCNTTQNQSGDVGKRLHDACWCAIKVKSNDVLKISTTQRWIYPEETHLGCWNQRIQTKKHLNQLITNEHSWWLMWRLTSYWLIFVRLWSCEEKCSCFKAQLTHKHTPWNTHTHTFTAPSYVTTVCVGDLDLSHRGPLRY